MSMSSIRIQVSMLICITANVLYCATPYEILNQKAQTTGQKTFGINQLLKNFDPLMLEQWDAVVEECESFIKHNATGDKKLLNAIAELKKTNVTIYRTILRLSQVIKVDKALSDTQRTSEMIDANNVLKDAEQKLTTIMNSIDTTYYISGKKKSRELLDTLETVLRFAANKGQKEIAQTSNTAAPNKDILAANLVGYHNALFGVDKLFAKQLAQNDIHNWNTTVESVELFIKQHVTSDAELTKTMQILKKDNETLITTINESYKLFFAKQDQKNEPIRKNTAKSLDYIINELLAIENKLAAAIRKKYNNTGNQQSAELLHRLAISLSTVAEKAQRELDPTRNYKK